MSEWISVEDRKPTEEDADEKGCILAVLKKENRAKCWFWDIIVDYPEEFSYWMPIPEPPKGVRE